jgi:glycosyltransferase involved in cell wall biosynthesis
VGADQENVALPANIDIKVEFLGSLNPIEVSELLAKTHILVVPSITDNSPSVVGEGQRAGCIVLGTKVGGIPEIIQDGIDGFTCEPIADNLRSKIEMILGNGNLWNISQQAKHSFEKRFNEESIIRNHLEIYSA